MATPLPANPAAQSQCVYNMHLDLNQIYLLLQALPNSGTTGQNPPSVTNILTGNSATYVAAKTAIITAAGANPIQTMQFEQLADASIQWVISLNIA
jgi:hypothetical protein